MLSAVEGTTLLLDRTRGLSLYDNGTSWTAAGLRTLLFQPLPSGYEYLRRTIYTGVSNGGIFLSTDNGTSWTAVDTA